MGFGQLKPSIFIACLLLMTTNTFAADKLLVKTLQDPKTNCMITGERTSMNKVEQSEENRDHKTFQIAKITIKASPEAVFKTFTDYDKTTKIFSYLKKSKILTVNGSTKTVECESEIADGLLKFQYVLEFT